MFVCLQCIFYVHLHKSIDIFSYSIYLSSFPPFPPRVWPGSRAVTFLSPHYRYTWIKSGHLLESSHRYTWFKTAQLLESSLQVNLAQDCPPSFFLCAVPLILESSLQVNLVQEWSASWVLFTGKKDLWADICICISANCYSHRTKYWLWTVIIKVHLKLHNIKLCNPKTSN